MIKKDSYQRKLQIELLFHLAVGVVVASVGVITLALGFSMSGKNAAKANESLNIQSVDYNSNPAGY